MVITPIKTKPIQGKQKIFNILDDFLPSLKEGSIVVITSKIISICEGEIVPIGSINKSELITKEADYILDAPNPYNLVITIKDGLLLPTAGIDESNGDGQFILWPKNAQKTANKIRGYLIKKFKLSQLGIIITDSKSSPFRRGTTGISISYSGFLPLKSYIGKTDIFGRKLKVTKANIVDGLAASAVLAMGEGNEQTPLCTITDLPFVKFKKTKPLRKELNELKVPLEDDLYWPVFKSAPWKKLK